MIGKYLELVKFSHTLFALPFALMSMATAANGFPNPTVILCILLAMVSARTMAMTFNRIVDWRYDRHNPRTMTRPLVTGEIAFASAWILWAASSALFFASAWMLNMACLLLSPLVWLVLNGYSYSKRFTHWTHLWLGLSLALAPLGAWVAVTGKIEWLPIPLSAGVLFWVAGFDIIYALQDEAFDQGAALHSLVIRFGAHRALWVSRIFHILSMLAFLAYGYATGMGGYFYAGAAMVAIALAVEQSLVSAEDRSRINAAFFTANGFISLSFLIMTGLDILLR